MAVLRIRTNRRQDGGIRAFLPTILMVVLTPVIAWFVLGYLEEKPETKEEPVKEKKEKGFGAPRGLAVPVISGQLGFINGNPKNGMYPRIAATNDIPSNRMGLEEMIITLADRTVHNAVAQIYVIGEDTDEVMRRINLTRREAVSFFERVTNHLSLKTMDEVQAPAFRNVLRAEILVLCDEFLGTNIVQEVVISKFLSK